MIIQLTDTWARISGRVPTQLYPQIREALSYSRSTYGWNRELRRKAWTSHRISLAELIRIPGQSWEALRFPAGLWHRVQPLIPPEAQVVDTRGEVPARLDFERPLDDGTVLYPDQIEALHALVEARRGLAHLATNFGKTPLIAGLLRAWPLSRALVLIDQKSLVEQTVRELTKFLGEDVGVFGGGRKVRGSRVTVGTVQTIYRALAGPAARVRWLQDVEILIADEVHRVSPTWLTVMAECPAPVRLGVSGTIKEAKHKLPVEAFFGPVVHTVEDKTLIAAGRSTPTRVYMPYIPHETMYAGVKDFDAIYEACIVGSAVRNEFFADVAAAAARAGHATLVYFYRIEHGERLTRLCQARYDGPVTLLHGLSSPTASVRGINQAAAGEPGIYLLGTGYAQGVDMPGATVLINATAWKSAVATSQRAGRILRITPRSALSHLIDAYDVGVDALKNEAEARASLYKRKGFDVRKGPLKDIFQEVCSTVAGCSGCSGQSAVSILGTFGQ